MKHGIIILLICFSQKSVGFYGYKCNRLAIGSYAVEERGSFEYYFIKLYNCTKSEFNTITQNSALINSLLRDCEFNKINHTSIVSQSSCIALNEGKKNIPYDFVYGFKTKNDAYATSIDHK